LISGGAPAKRAEVKARAGREFISPLFLPAPPERQNLASGFSSKKSSDFVQKVPQAEKGFVIGEAERSGEQEKRVKYG